MSIYGIEGGKRKKKHQRLKKNGCGRANRPTPMGAMAAHCLAVVGELMRSGPGRGPGGRWWALCSWVDADGCGLEQACRGPVVGGRDGGVDLFVDTSSQLWPFALYLPGLGGSQLAELSREAIPAAKQQKGPRARMGSQLRTERLVCRRLRDALDYLVVRAKVLLRCYMSKLAPTTPKLFVSA